MTDTIPDNATDPIPVALALLDRRWPVSPALDDSNGIGTMTALAADPRYLVDRLYQGLADELSPMDSVTALLSQALKDAIAWRQHDCRRCGQSLCAQCNADRAEGPAPFPLVLVPAFLQFRVRVDE